MKSYLAIVLLMLSAGVVLADSKPRRASAVDAAYVNKPLIEGAAIWHCWYSKDIHVNCMLGDPGTQPVPPSASPVGASLGEILVTSPQSVSSNIVRIPLFTVPYSHSLVGELAESVVCGRRSLQACGIIYAESNAKLARLVLQREAQKAEQIQAAQILAAMVR